MSITSETAPQTQADDDLASRFPQNFLWGAATRLRVETIDDFEGFF